MPRSENRGPYQGRLGPNQLRAWLRSELVRREWTRADGGPNASDLARAAGMRETTVARYLQNDPGSRTPEPWECQRLADALGVPVERLLQLAGWMPPPEDREETAADEIMLRVRRVRWTEERRRGLLALLDQWRQLDSVGGGSDRVVEPEHGGKHRR